MKTFAVIGPGAVGTTIAKAIQDSGLDLTLYGREDKNVILEDFSSGEETRLRVKALNQATEHVDVIFIAVKAPQLQSVLDDLPRLCHQDTCVVLCQNGMGQLKHLSSYNAYHAVIYISGQKSGDHITHYRDYDIHVQNTKTTSHLKATLQHSALNVHLSDDVARKQWYKLLVNIGINSVTAYYAEPASVLKNKEAYHMTKALIQEGFNVAVAQGIDFEDTIMTKIMRIYEGYPDEMGTSMYYDIINKRPLELEVIHGYVRRVAHINEVSTPTLNKVYHDWKDTEKRYLEV